MTKRLTAILAVLLFAATAFAQPATRPTTRPLQVFDGTMYANDFQNYFAVPKTRQRRDFPVAWFQFQPGWGGVAANARYTQATCPAGSIFIIDNEPFTAPGYDRPAFAAASAGMIREARTAAPGLVVTIHDEPHPDTPPYLWSMLDAAAPQIYWDEEESFKEYAARSRERIAWIKRNWDQQRPVYPVINAYTLTDPGLSLSSYKVKRMLDFYRDLHREGMCDGVAIWMYESELKYRLDPWEKVVKAGR